MDNLEPLQEHPKKPLRNDEHAIIRNIIIKASLDDMKTQIQSLPALIPLLPTCFLNSLTVSEQTRAYRYILFCWAVSNQSQCPKEMQLRAALSLWQGKDVFVQAGTGEGKTLAAVLNQLLDDSNGLTLILSPLKRLQSTQVCLIYSRLQYLIHSLR